MKRFLDLCIAITGIIVLSPLFLCIMLLIRLKIGSPVFFVQQRPGLHGRPFAMIKFRTMSEARDSRGDLLPDSRRLVPLGRFLRSTSLDELPELWNVLAGDMSIVGPRPLLMEYLPLYSAKQARRHEVRPGITGWAQVNGRNTVGWEERFAMDVWYVDNQSLVLDVKIIWLTILKVVRREGINQEGSSTMEKFRGSAADGEGR